MYLIKSNNIPENQVTDHATYLNRRDFIKASAGLGLMTASGLSPIAAFAKDAGFNTTEEKTSLAKITTYCNFYEFGTAKTDPAQNAHTMSISPWDVEVVGECEKPGIYAIEDLLKKVKIEERIYRFRCVEGWSMVIPWTGFPLHQLIKAMQPTSKAKYVQFDTLYDPDSMPGQRTDALEWPYVEGLRMDEAMHPLTLMATGLYGQDLPKQNGAPMRLVVPWKYGFKSIKSIVRIHFTEVQPINSWQKSNPSEYGFYSNVNPGVPHPRWSQARERRIGEFFKRKTEMYNGYGEQVASLYTGMDLKQLF